MDAQGFFFQAFVYLTAAVLSVPIARRLGLGSVLGYLIAGAVIGPAALELVGGEGQDVLRFAEFGVVMMLFLIGLELEPEQLWRLRGVLLGMGGLQVLGTAAVLAGAAGALGLDWKPALAVGLVLSLSSTAIVLQSLREKGLLRSDAGERAFGVLLLQDIAVIPMLVALPLLATLEPAAAGEAHAAPHGWIAEFTGWARAGATLAAIAAIVLAGRFAMRPFFRFLARSGVREVFTAGALLLVVGIALLMQSVGLSPALGSFLGGVVLASSEYRHQLESDIEPFKGLLLGLFFIAVGASLDFRLVAAESGAIAGLVLALMVVKFAVLFALGRAWRMGLDQNLLFSLALAQGGEFGFVLFSFAAQSGVLDPQTANRLVAVVALSMAGTPFLLLLHERLLQPRLGRERAARAPDAIEEQNPVILAGFGAFGSIVGRFLVANGVATTVLDVDSDHVDLLRRLGIRAYYGDASREELLRAAGAERARLLIVATGGADRTIAVIRTARKHFPGLAVYARARSRLEGYDLFEAGAHRVYRGSLDTSLRTGVDALRALGFPSHPAHRAAQAFRRHDERAWLELAAVRKDPNVFQTRARESIRVLEELLRAEFHEREVPDDFAWDSSSLRAEYGKPGEP